MIIDFCITHCIRVIDDLLLVLTVEEKNFLFTLNNIHIHYANEIFCTFPRFRNP